MSPPPEPPVVIEGVRLRLRRATPDDAASVFAASGDPQVMCHLDWPVQRHAEEARRYLEGAATRWVAGTEYQWMIEAKPAGAVLGSIACRVQGHAAEVGLLLPRGSWGRGHGTEAAQLLLGWLKRQPGIVRIWATVDPDNARAARLLARLGFRLEGVMRRANVRPNLPGPPRDTAIHAIVRGEPGGPAGWAEASDEGDAQ